MPERWAQVVVYRQAIPDPSYDHYEVSTHGRLRRAGSDRVLKGTTSKKGYKNIELQPKKGTMHAPMVTQVGTLVAWAFLGPPPTKDHLVAHRDLAAGNDHLRNLEYATRGEIWERTRRSVEQRKERLYASLAKRTVAMCLSLVAMNLGDVALALAWERPQSACCAVEEGRTWSARPFGWVGPWIQ